MSVLRRLSRAARARPRYRRPRQQVGLARDLVRSRGHGSGPRVDAARASSVSATRVRCQGPSVAWMTRSALTRDWVVRRCSGVATILTSTG